jgi:recombinational DNA repair ATPase RecF
MNFLRSKPVHMILIWGLECTGKTSLLQSIVYSNGLPTIPTISQSDIVEWDGEKFRICEIRSGMKVKLHEFIVSGV